MRIIPRVSLTRVQLVQSKRKKHKVKLWSILMMISRKKVGSSGLELGRQRKLLRRRSRKRWLWKSLKIESNSTTVLWEISSIIRAWLFKIRTFKSICRSQSIHKVLRDPRIPTKVKLFREVESNLATCLRLRKLVFLIWSCRIHWTWSSQTLKISTNTRKWATCFSHKWAKHTNLSSS